MEQKINQIKTSKAEFINREVITNKIQTIITANLIVVVAFGLAPYDLMNTVGGMVSILSLPILTYGVFNLHKQGKALKLHCKLIDELIKEANDLYSIERIKDLML